MAGRGGFPVVYSLFIIRGVDVVSVIATSRLAVRTSTPWQDATQVLPRGNAQWMKKEVTDRRSVQKAFCLSFFLFCQTCTFHHSRNVSNYFVLVRAGCPCGTHEIHHCVLWIVAVSFISLWPRHEGTQEVRRTCSFLSFDHC